MFQTVGNACQAVRAGAALNQENMPYGAFAVCAMLRYVRWVLSCVRSTYRMVMQEPRCDDSNNCRPSALKDVRVRIQYIDHGPHETLAKVPRAMWSMVLNQSKRLYAVVSIHRQRERSWLTRIEQRTAPRCCVTMHANNNISTYPLSIIKRFSCRLQPRYFRQCHSVRPHRAVYVKSTKDPTNQPPYFVRVVRVPPFCLVYEYTSKKRDHNIMRKVCSSRPNHPPPRSLNPPYRFVKGWEKRN